MLILAAVFALNAVLAKDIQRVVVLDSGLDLNDKRFSKVLCPYGHRDFTGEGMVDNLGHGTVVAGIIAPYVIGKPACLLIIKVFGVKDNTFKRTLRGMKWALEQKSTLINFSGGGDEPYLEEQRLIDAHPEVTFVVAAGNDNRNIDKYGYYPASYNFPNVIAVGSLNREGHKSSFSNYGNTVDAWELGEEVLSTWPNGRKAYGNGTSMATAIHTGKLIHD